MRIRTKHTVRRPGRLIALAGALVALPQLLGAQVTVDPLELTVALRTWRTHNTLANAANSHNLPRHATRHIQVHHVTEVR